MGPVAVAAQIFRCRDAQPDSITENDSGVGPIDVLAAVGAATPGSGGALMRAANHKLRDAGRLPKIILMATRAVGLAFPMAQAADLFAMFGLLRPWVR